MPAKEKCQPLHGKTYPDTLAEQVKALETDETVLSYKASRQKLASDPCRPLYHYSAHTGFGDPNGLCHWQGRYHLFYQFGPQGAARVHWGHCYSEDLVHWHDLPPALYPDTELHCYSGQTLVEADRVIAAYHGKESGNSLATASDPLLLNWMKNPNNPVIPNMDADENARPYVVFDPCIWKEDDGYYALSGTSIDGFIRERRKTAEHLFYSKDLDHWEYLHPLLVDGFFSEPGEDGAVPNFWPIGNGKHMLLLFSHKRSARYYIGQYDRQNHRFVPDYHGRIRHSAFVRGSVHCPSATIDAKGRYLAMFNCSEGTFQAGGKWEGCMTLPWHFSLKDDDLLAIEPVEEINALRFDHQEVQPLQLQANEERVLDSVRGKSIEIDVTLDMAAAREAGLYVLRSPDGRENTKISIYSHDHLKTNDTLQIDASQSSLRADVIGQPPELAPLRLSEDRRARLRIFVDRSIIEVFADNGQCRGEWRFPRKGVDKIFPLFPRQCAVARVYPEREDSNGISLFSRGGAARIVSMDVWQMRSIWPELKYREGE